MDSALAYQQRRSGGSSAHPRITTILKIVFILQNIAAHVVVMVIILPMFDAYAGNGNLLLRFAGMYPVAMFFLLCLEYLIYLRLPSKIFQLLVLLIPNYLFLGYALYGGADPTQLLVEGAMLYVTPQAIAWLITFFGGIGKEFIAPQRQMSIPALIIVTIMMGGLCILPPVAAAIVYWLSVYPMYEMTRFLGIFAIVIVNIISQVRVIGIGVFFK